MNKILFPSPMWWLSLVCCVCCLLAACGENTPRKFAQGFRELRWHAPLNSVGANHFRPLAPERPLFPFLATILVRRNEAAALGQIPATRICYAFTDAGLQGVRIEFSPEYLLPVRKYFLDSYGPAKKAGQTLIWKGYGVGIRLFSNAPGGPFALILGPAAN